MKSGVNLIQDLVIDFNFQYVIMDYKPASADQIFQKDFL